MTEVYHTATVATVVKFYADLGAAGRAVVKVASKSNPKVEHTVWVDCASGKAAHASGHCDCPAANAGRKCWHLGAAIDAAKSFGLPVKGPHEVPYCQKRRPSVFDRKPRRDRAEEI